MVKLPRYNVEELEYCERESNIYLLSVFLENHIMFENLHSFRNYRKKLLKLGLIKKKIAGKNNYKYELSEEGKKYAKIIRARKGWETRKRNYGSSGRKKST